ncbi:unnamed protein product [Thlaspi arvense]|uniref:Reverse transcriptase zinc-binding domain-containing protein n=1 Tax=Thlaspi arvense TaxID=13288 RepID=A0AAU9S2B5_THLAR|nr:unnamed protein product [Thlaspi arvense]
MEDAIALAKRDCSGFALHPSRSVCCKYFSRTGYYSLGSHEPKKSGFLHEQNLAFLAAYKSDQRLFKLCVPKHAFNFWVANLDRLPLNTRLAAWGLHVSPRCTFCSASPELRDHLFFQCEVSSALVSWQALLQWLLQGNNWANVLLLKRLVSQATVYFIWSERNSRRYNLISLTPDSLFSKIDSTVRAILLGRRTRKGCSHLLSLWFRYCN